ncbi:MAG: hypothetical protein EU541_05400 [Promethearchaeota archaeon]|nr:MAG: hypothetical protein EU541_05400 [Candidatus Lokiarchaeota archaeon]
MGKLLIKNGFVFDPLNGIEGEKKDILIEKRKIVEKFSSQNNIKDIDASGKTVIPAAVDIHAHIASQQVNWARLLGTKKREFVKDWNRLTLENIAKEYIKNGYTFVIDANVYPSISKQTIFDFSNLPVLDKGMLLNVSNIWALEDEFQRGKIKELSYFLSDLLSSCKGFGIKVYNPFEAEAWNFKILRENIEKGGKLYNFTALDVYKNLTKAAEYLMLPHSVHAHIEGYESQIAKDNLNIVLDSIDFTELKRGDQDSEFRNQVFHLAHANSYNMDGDNANLIDFLNSNSLVDVDLGFIGFDKLNPLITSDRRLINDLLNSNENNTKVIRSANESEGDSFVTFRRFDKKNKNHCIMWANAIELALKVKNKWQIQLSFNYPNYSNVKDLPEIMTWLISKKARDSYMKDMNEDFLKNSSLNGNSEILSFNDFITITRASPAKSLGLADIKGSFSLGSDGDVNILNIDLSDIDLSKDYEKLEKAFKDIEYVIKGGEIIKKERKMNLLNNGKIFWTDREIQGEEKTKIMKKKKEFYQKYYSTFYDSLQTSMSEKLLRKV